VETEVDHSSNLFDWFSGRVRDARASTGVELSEDSTLYLVQLLAERARTDLDAPEAHTLVDLHAQAINAPPAEQMRAYRELGDRALYALGYFPESVRRRSVGPRYYADMGAAAYARTDQVFKRWFANAFGDVFAELAQGFRGCVNVLGEVRRSCNDEPDLIMRLYARWLDTGDADAAERLRAHGLILPPRAAPV
jgi:hypothetical protein